MMVGRLELVRLPSLPEKAAKVEQDAVRGGGDGGGGDAAARGHHHHLHHHRLRPVDRADLAAAAARAKGGTEESQFVARSGNVDVVRLLLDKGADVEARSKVRGCSLD